MSALKVRTGLNTGEVVAGDAGSGQAFATGPAIAIAERLESAAAPGEILVGAATFRLVRHAVSAEPVDAIPIKGREHREQAWRLMGVAEAPGTARRLDTQLLGRNRELDVLRTAYDRIYATRTPQLVTVFGFAGVGKTRLVNEFLEGLGQGPLLLYGRCLEYGEGITFSPLVDVVRTAADIEKGQSPAVARAQIYRLVHGETDADSIVEHIAAAIGLVDYPSTADETFWATRRLVETLALEAPVVLVFEDVHWGENTFLDLLEYLGRHVHGPVLLVCLARPELHDARPEWERAMTNAIALRVEPLGAGDAAQLVQDLLGGPVAAKAARAIADAADGNPLFVEEIVATLVEARTLRCEEGVWRAEDLSTISVPPTIQALLAARLDRLPQHERLLLEAAAVSGRSFGANALRELTSDDQLTERLDELARKEFIVRERGGVTEATFGFRHVLIREVAYSGTSKRRRAALHKRMAMWLERDSGEGGFAVDELTGYHLERAYTYSAELGTVRDDVRQLGVRAGERLTNAGRRAADRGDAPAAANLLRRASRLPSKDDSTETKLLLDLTTALRDSGKLDEATETIETTKRRARTSRDPELGSYAALEASFLRFYTWTAGELDELLRVADEAIAVFTGTSDDAGLAKAWALVAQIHYVRGRIAAMQTSLELAISHARRSGQSAHTRALESALGRAALGGPTPVHEAVKLCARIQSDSGGDRTLDAVIAAVLAQLYAMKGNFSKARELYRHSQTTLEDLGRATQLAAVRIYSGRTELLAGDPIAAEHELRQSYVELKAIRERGILSTVVALLAQTVAIQGRDGEALALAEESEQLAPAEDVETQVLWRTVRAQVYAQTAMIDEAKRLADTAIQIASATDYLVLQADAFMARALVAGAEFSPNDEAVFLQQAIHLYNAKGNTVSAGQAQVRLNAIVSERRQSATNFRPRSD